MARFAGLLYFKRSSPAQRIDIPLYHGKAVLVNMRFPPQNPKKGIFALVAPPTNRARRGLFVCEGRSPETNTLPKQGPLGP